MLWCLHYHTFRIELEGITDRSALDGAKEVEHVEHRAIGGGERRCHSGGYYCNAHKNLHTFIWFRPACRFISSPYGAGCLRVVSRSARLRQRSNFLDFQHSVRFKHNREPGRAVVQRLKHANLSLELSHSKHFIYSIKTSQIPYSVVNKAVIGNGNNDSY
jgi:hypothetical protein